MYAICCLSVFLGNREYNILYIYPKIKYEYEFLECSLQNCKSINTLSHKEVIGGQFSYQPR